MGDDYIPDEDFDALNAEEAELSDAEDAPDAEDAGYESEATEDGDYNPEQGDDKEELREVGKKERERLRMQAKVRKQQLDKLRDTQNAEADATEDQKMRNRMKFLFKQAEVFQHFAGDQFDAAKKKKGKGRHGGSNEEDEDAELLRDEDDAPMRGHRLTVQPSVIKGGTMREYQIQGLNWLVHLYDNGINGILADEMGLGKTLQTISLLGYLQEFRNIRGPHLVIVPKSTLHNWLNEFRKWCPSIKAFKFHGNKEEREAQKAEHLQPGKFDVVITSYEMVIKEKNTFRRFHFRYMIIDEAHRIKNENSILSRVIRMIKVNYRLLITGTPLQNNLHELWALLNFLLPEIFSSADTFEQWFSIKSGDSQQEAEVVQQLHKVLRPFLLRRVKSDVERGMPPKRETILKIGMSEMQRKFYKMLLQKDIEAINGTGERSRLLNIVMQLRKCCNHPYLFQGAEPGPPYLEGPHLMENSGKMMLLHKLLPRLKQKGSRVLIFSQMTRMIDILEDYCRYQNHQYCRIDGNTSGDDREAAIDAFNADGSEKFIFLLSTRAGGLGINLATADIVVLYDSDWNPQMDLQAMDRAHRIGQKKEVQVFRFCIDQSVEEKVIEKAYKKLRLDALVIQQGRMTEKKTQVNKDDLLSMVRYGAESVFSSDAASITDADVDLIIQKGVRETEQLNEKLQQFTEDAAKFTMDGGDAFNAYDYRADEGGEGEADGDTLKSLMASNWVEPERRQRKRANYSENDYFKATLASSKADKPKGPRLPKMPALQDFQFYQLDRITELFQKDHAFETFKHQQAQKETALRSQGLSDDAVAAEIAASVSPDDPVPLTDEELAERDRLLEAGFSNWNRRDFNAFVRGCEKHGRQMVEEIAKDIDGKSFEEVQEYAKVFWARYSEIADWEKHIKAIERGEQKIQRQDDIMDAIGRKLDRCANPWQELKIYYGNNKGKAYTEEEDRFIICAMHKLGYGAWDDLKAEIRRSWRFRFDWFMKSRTPQELARRCETLIRLIEKENEELDAAEGTTKSGGRKRKSMSQPNSAPGSPRKVAK